MKIFNILNLIFKWSTEVKQTALRIAHYTLFLSLSFAAFPQQDAHFTQYMFNNQYFNPAFAGTADYITGTIFYRHQWAGMPGNPVTQNLTGIVPFKRNHFALAFNLVNDQIGQVRAGSLNINLAFAYYLNLANGRLSFGLGAGLQQYQVDANTLNTADNTDQAFSGNSFAPRIAPDFNFGVFYKTNRYYLGISSTHLNNPGRRLTSYIAENPAVTARHYYFTAGYTFEIDEKFKITPSIINKLSESKLFDKNFSTDISVKTDYIDMVWLGASYRTTNALAFFTGVNVGRIDPDVFKENIRIGYAYDISVGSQPSFNNGSHEIFISYEYAPKVKRMMPKFK